MDSKDLRIGNIITDAMYFRPLTVFAIKQNGTDARYKGEQNTEIEGIRCSYFGYDTLIGVHLTPEILEKCGFVSNGDRLILKINPIFSIGQRLMAETGVLLYAKGGCASDAIKYLHQLQNLYYSLCGKELPVSL